MTNCVLKVKINDYFPKIDSIPYEDYACVIIYNNIYTEIKLSQNDNQIFMEELMILNNDDIILNIKLIDYTKRNTLIGNANVLIPYIKINQMLKKIFLSYHQQIQLRMNPNVKLNHLNKEMNNISNIYLDLIIEISLKKKNINKIPLMKYKINNFKNFKIYDYKGQKPIRESFKLNNNQNNNNGNIYNEDIISKKINFLKSPLLSKNNSFYKSINNNNYIKFYNKPNNKNKDKCFDINYNVINNNFLNYISTDNNSFIFNYHLKNKENNSFIARSMENNDKYKISKNNSFKTNENKYCNYPYNNYLISKNIINSRLKKSYNKSDNLTEISNTIIDDKKNSKNLILNDNDNNYITSWNRDNTENNINNTNSGDTSVLYNKKYLQKYVNKKLNKKTQYSPMNFFNNNRDNKKLNSFVFFENYNISENFDSTSLNTKNSKKSKEMSSVLNYFSHVKPFIRKSIKTKKNSIIKNNDDKDKKNIINNTEIDNKKDIIKDDGGNKIEINNKYSITEVLNVTKTKLNNNTEIQEEDITQLDLKDKIIKLINDNTTSTKEIKQKIKINNDLIKKYLLIEEKYYGELKTNNSLINKNNHKTSKQIIHVNINSKINEKLYLKLKNIKNKEFYILEKIFEGNKTYQAKKKIQEKLEQQKKFHALLKVIRDLIQKYDNLSQIYKDDENKKILFKSLLVRYGIREKEEKKDNNNLLDKYKELQNNIKNEKNKLLIEGKKNEMMTDIYKNVINEEDSEDCKSSLSGKKSKQNILKKLSWCSEDSVIEEKENFDKIDENKNDNSLEILSEKKGKDVLIDENPKDNHNNYLEAIKELNINDI